MRARHWTFLVAALAAAATVALLVGPASVAPSDVFAALAGRAGDDAAVIVWSIRLPRIALGAIVGAGLSASGATLQATLRNPLAEPYLLGVSGGAAVGAVLVTIIGAEHPAAVQVAAFGGAAVAVLLAVAVAHAAGARGSSPMLVMAGVVVGAFANAVILIVIAGAPPGAIQDALWWLMGSLSGANWNMVAWLAAFVAAGTAALWALGREVDVLSLGADAAAALGVHVERATRRAFLVSAFVAAATVSTAGLIGFVGLVVPAMARALGARSTRGTLVASCLAGAALVVAADVVARVVRAPVELPLGAVTAIIGVPFFLVRLRRLA